MVDFVLVHGGLAGAWCWKLFQPELQRLGHRTHTLDLPIGDPAATLDDYASVVVDVVERLEQPWLIGHSMGGLVIPRAGLRADVGGLIFLCAGFPPRTPEEDRENYEARNPGNEAHFIPDGEGRIMLSFEGAAHDFFNDCPEDLQRWAYSSFRPQATAAFSEYAPIDHYPDVPMHAVVGSDDNIVIKAKHSELIRSRIGVEPVELPGGHCPFISRPRHLAEVVDGLIVDAEGRQDRNATSPAP